MADQVSLTIIGNDLGNIPFQIKKNLDPATTFQELSEFIIQEKKWDTEALSIRFYSDAKHMNEFQDNDSYTSLCLTGDITVYAKLEKLQISFLAYTAKSIKVTLIVDGKNHGELNVEIDTTLNQLMEFSRDNDHLPDFTDHYQVHIVPPTSKGQKRKWKRSEYGKSLQELEIDFDLTLEIDSVAPAQQAHPNQQPLPIQTPQFQGAQITSFQPPVQQIQNPQPLLFQQPNAQLPPQFNPVQVQAPVVPYFQQKSFPQYTQPVNGPQPPVFQQPAPQSQQQLPPPIQPTPQFQVPTINKPPIINPQGVPPPVSQKVTPYNQQQLPAPWIQAPVFKPQAPQQQQQWPQHSPIYPPPHCDIPNAINASNQPSIISNQMQGLHQSNAQALNTILKIQIDRAPLSEYQERNYRSIKIYLQDGSMKQLWLKSKKTFRDLSDAILNKIESDPIKYYIQFFTDDQCLNRCPQSDKLTIFSDEQEITLFVRMRKVQNKYLRLNLTTQQVLQTIPELKNYSEYVSLIIEQSTQDKSFEEITTKFKYKNIQFEQTLVTEDLKKFRVGS